MARLRYPALFGGKERVMGYEDNFDRPDIWRATHGVGGGGAAGGGGGGGSGGCFVLLLVLGLLADCAKDCHGAVRRSLGSMVDVPAEVGHV